MTRVINCKEIAIGRNCEGNNKHPPLQLSYPNLLEPPRGSFEKKQYHLSINLFRKLKMTKIP